MGDECSADTCMNGKQLSRDADATSNMSNSAKTLRREATRPGKKHQCEKVEAKLYYKTVDETYIDFYEASFSSLMSLAFLPQFQT